ncbi:MAG: inositol monophosphatase [Rickettsiales bacterium]|nr:inositol monophosphatase [Rickettsiales bacterium]
MQYSALINVMSAAVQKVSKRILRDFHELRFLQSSRKPLDKFLGFTVSNAEKAMFEILHKARPEFGIISKYCDYEKSSEDICWVVNILDGIENFARAVPYFAISVSVREKKNMELDEEMTAGVIYLPALDELYFAEKEKGAWCEFFGEFRAGFSKNRLKLSKKTLSKPITFTNDHQFNDVNSSMRMLGCSSISMAYLASGRGDECVLNYDSISDIGAGIIIAKEAGAIVKNNSQSKKLIVERP